MLIKFVIIILERMLQMIKLLVATAQKLIPLTCIFSCLQNRNVKQIIA